MSRRRGFQVPEEGLALVEPKRFDLSAIEGLKVKADKPLSVDIKRMLVRMVDEQAHTETDSIRDLKSNMKEAARQEFLKSVDYDKFQEELSQAERQVLLIRARMADHGIDKNGSPWSQYGDYEVQAIMTDVEKERAKEAGCRFARAMGGAEEQVLQYTTQVEKIKTKLLLCSTYGDALTIMSTVFGNGDRILKESAHD